MFIYKNGKKVEANLENGVIVERYTSSKSKTWLYVLIAIILIIIIAAGGWYWYSKSVTTGPVANSQTPSITSEDLLSDLSEVDMYNDF
ncbi:MAG: hypothetical protein JKX76_01375 [Colwellia sp.]|nr:hypothetical protein [Colwellia sp.]